MGYRTFEYLKLYLALGWQEFTGFYTRNVVFIQVFNNRVRNRTEHEILVLKTRKISRMRFESFAQPLLHRK